MDTFIKGSIILISLYLMLTIYYKFEKLKRAQRWFSKRKFPKDLEAGVNQDVRTLYRAMLAKMQQSLDGRAGEIVKLYLQQGVIHINTTLPISTSFNGVDIAKALQLLKYDFLTVYGHAKIGDDAITESQLTATFVSPGEHLMGGGEYALPNLSDATATATTLFEHGVLFQPNMLFFLNISAVIATSDTNPYYAKHFLNKGI